MGRSLKMIILISLFTLALGTVNVPVEAAGPDQNDQFYVRQTPLQGGQDLLNEGNALYGAGDFHGAIEKYLAAVESFKAENNYPGQAMALNNLGMASGKLFRFEDAVAYFAGALEVLEITGDQNGQAILTTNLGDAYFNLDRYPESLVAYQQSYEFRQALGDERGMGWALTNIGAVYRELNEFSIAIDHYDQALQIHQRYGDLNGRATTINNRAVALHDLGSLQLAAEGYQEAIELWEDLGHVYGIAAVQINLGDLYKNLGQFERSRLSYQAAAETFHDTGNPVEEAIALTGLGSVRQYLNDYPGAIAYYQQALGIHELLGNLSGRGTVLHNIASVLDAQGDYPAAVDNYLAALEIDRQIGDRLSEASTLSALGLTYTHQGDHASALETLEEAVSIAEETTSQEILISAVNNLSLAEHALAYFDRAIARLLDIESIAREMDNPSFLASILNNLGFTYSAMGDYEQAQFYFEQALALFDENGDLGGMANALNNIAGIHQSRSDYEMALVRYLEAAGIAEEIGARAMAMTTMNNIGMVYLDLGMPDQARESIEEAISLAREIGDAGAEATSLNNLGMVLVALEDHASAKDNFLAALTLHVDSGARQGQLRVLNNLGTLLIRDGDYAGGIAHFNTSLQIAEEIGSQGDIAVAYANLGWAYSQSGDLVEGDKFNLQALEQWRFLGNRRGEFHTLFNLGLRYETNDDPTTALDYYLQAIGVLESIIGDLSVGDYQSAFTDQFTEVYQRAVRLQSEMGLLEEGFDLSERARSRAFLDSLGGQQPVLSDQTDADLLAEEILLQAEISQLEGRLVETRALPSEQRDQTFTEELESELIGKQTAYQDLLAQITLTNPQMISLVSISTITTAEVQAALDDHTTLISFFLTDTTSLAFVFTDNSLDLVVLPLSPQEIEAAVESFRGLGLANPGGPVPASLKTLYEGLIEPLEGFLSRPVVALVPHQSLHYVPFAALHNGDQFLGEQFIIYYLPSVSTQPFVDQKTGRPLTNPVVLGNPALPNSNLPTLGYADQEALQVAELFSVDALLGVDATETSITNRIDGSGLLHIAAHGSYNQAAPQFSRIWLAADDVQDGRLNVYEVYSLNLQSVDLVTLSACQSNLGDLSSGDELVGLSRAFLYGSSSVVASLWSVDDQSTSALMTSFYSYLAEGKGKAEALQAAQGDVRENPDHPEWAHPYYWAAFVLNGDPGDFQSNLSGSIGQSSRDQGTVFGLPAWLIYTIGGAVVIGGGIVAIRIVSAMLRRKDHLRSTGEE